MSLFKEFSRDLDAPIPWEEKGYFKKGKVRVIIVNEDLSGSVYFRKFPKTHVYEIKQRYYFFVSKCVLNLDFPTIVYFYNNPKPLFFQFQKSDLQASSLYNAEQLLKLPEGERFLLAETFLDAESVKLLGNALYMRGLLPAGWLTWKVLLIILAVLFVMVLVILQVTCKADLFNLKMCAKKMVIPLGPFILNWFKLKRRS